MRGTKRQVRPGAWELRAYIGRDDAGRVKHKYRTIHGTAREADRALRQLVAEVEDGQHQIRRHVGTLNELIDAWIEVKSRDWAPRTTRENRAFAARYLAPKLGDRSADSIGPADLRELYHQLQDEVGTPTARRAHVHMSGIFTEAVFAERLTENPCKRVRPPKADEKQEKEVHINDVVKVMRSVDLEFGSLIRVALATGARRGELAGLRWDDIDVGDRKVTFRRAVSQGLDAGTIVKGLKSGNAKAVAVDQGTLDVLASWRAESERRWGEVGEQVMASWYVWGGAAPIHPDTITGRWSTARDAVGVPLRFHDIRHATASWMVSEGVGAGDGSKRLGNSPQVFSSTYTHAIPGRDREIADALGAAIEEAWDEDDAA